MPRLLAIASCALAFASAALTPAAHAQSSPTGPVPANAPYKNPRLPVAARVADLLGRMTLDEKVAQIRSMWAMRPKLDDSLLANSTQMDSLFGNGIGMMNPDFEVTLQQSVERRNRLQTYLLKKTRLGIPTIFIDEAHHGLLAPNVDVFPHGIALASTWDPALLERIYTYIAAQANARGTNLVLAPVVDVTRDPRWGRTGETFGEDPYLNGMIGSAVVAGFQGSHDGTIAPGHVAATLKHFTGHGEPIAGVNQGASDYGVRVLREIHMEPFRLCILNAHPSSIMASYDDVDGLPSHANRWLLTDVLRKEWHYPGIVVSDWFAIDQLWKKHHVEPDQRAAARRAFEAGVTIDLPFGVNYERIPELVRAGEIREADIDSAAAKILTLKFAMGLFEAKPISEKAALASVSRPEGRAMARQAAEEAMILLKNEGNLLPFRIDQFKTIAVVGPGAAVNYLGDYSGIPAKNVSLLEGIKQKVGNRVNIVYAQGVKLATNGDTISYNNYQNTGHVELPSDAEQQRSIAEAVSVAQRADAIVVAVGENELFSREAGSPDHFGDESTLDLPSEQNALVQAMVATGKPVVVYLMQGRPRSIPWIAAHVPAIVNGWFSGEEAGNAFANILFGDVNPSGKLTISMARSVGQLPIYYNHKPSTRFFQYVNDPGTPLFPFGFGLSYTTFSYSAPRLSATEMSTTGSTVVSVDVTNTGPRAGDEIVQLYVHPKTSSVTRPVKALKDFARIHLAPGEKKTVEFTLPASKLAIWTADMRYAVEPGDVEVMVGRSSAETQTVVLKVRDGQ